MKTEDFIKEAKDKHNSKYTYNIQKNTILKREKVELNLKNFQAKNFYTISIHSKPNILQNNEKMLYTHVFRIPNNLMIYKLK